MNWDVFISYVREDTEDVARPLADALRTKGFKVWFDQDALTVGDSLHRAIDDGLAKSRFGIVILSPNFFKKEWPQKELDGLVNRESDGGKVVLPVWHNMTAKEIRRYSPTLADRLAANTNEGIDAVVDALARAIAKPVTGEKAAEIGPAPAGPAASPMQTLWAKRKKTTITRSDWLALAGLLVAVLACVAGWLALPQIQSLVQGRQTPTGALPSATVAVIAFTSKTSTSAVTASTSNITATQAGKATPVTVVVPVPLLTPESTFSANPQTDTTKDVARITLSNGDSVLLANEWLFYTGSGDPGGVLEAGLKLQNQGDNLFADMASLSLEKGEQSGINATIQLSNGNTVSDAVASGFDSNGMIKGLSSQGVFYTALSDIQRIDFHQTTDTPITVNMATIVNTSGEKMSTPADLLESAFVRNDVIGYGYYTDLQLDWKMANGSTIPFRLMKGFEFQDGETLSERNIIYTLLDGSTFTSRLAETGGPMLRGLTKLGAFNLNLSNVKSVDFHRPTGPAIQSLMSTSALLTSKDGAQYEIPARWLIYDWQASFPLSYIDRIYFMEMKSFQVQTAKDSTTATVQLNLLSGQTIVKNVTAYGSAAFWGVTRSGEMVNIRVGDVGQIEFKADSQPSPSLPTATITIDDGTQLIVPAASVKVQLSGQDWGMYYHDYSDEVALTTGIKVPLSKIQKLEIGAYDTKISRYPVVVRLVDGETIQSYLANYFNPEFAICGIADSGPQIVKVDNLKSVEFHR